MSIPTEYMRTLFFIYHSINNLIRWFYPLLQIWFVYIAIVKKELVKYFIRPTIYCCYNVVKMLLVKYFKNVDIVTMLMVKYFQIINRVTMLLVKYFRNVDKVTMLLWNIVWISIFVSDTRNIFFFYIFQWICIMKHLKLNIYVKV